MKIRAISNTLAVAIMVVLVVASVLGTYFIVPAAPGAPMTVTTTRSVERTVTSTVTVERTVTPAPTPITIGATLPLTGPIAPDAAEFKRGFDLAIEKINAEGGILGRPVELILYDDGFDLAKVTPLYERLIVDDKVDILIGPLAEYLSTGAVPVAEKYGKPMFGYWIADAEFFRAGYKYIVGFDFNAAPGVESFGWWLGVADYFRNGWDYYGLPEPPKTIAMTAINTAYGVEVTRNMAPAFEQMGIRPVFTELHDIAITDWTPIIARLKAVEPDILFNGAFFPQGVLLRKQMIEQGLYVPAVVIEGATHTAWFTKPEFGGVSPELAEGVMSLGDPVRARQKGWGPWFMEEFQKRYGYLPDTVSGTAFSVMELAAKAVRLAGTLESDAVMEVLHRNIISNASQDVLIGPDGSNPILTHGAGQWINGEWHNVWPPEWSTATPVHPMPK